MKRLEEIMLTVMSVIGILILIAYVATAGYFAFMIIRELSKLM